MSEAYKKIQLDRNNGVNVEPQQKQQELQSQRSQRRKQSTFISDPKTQQFLDKDESLRGNEKIRTNIFLDSFEGSRYVAQEIADLIREKQKQGKQCILGLATGSSPVQTYRELIRLHKEDGLSFKNVVTFNLDEYYPLEKSAPQSYWKFMHENLFDHIDILPENVNIPDGTVKREELEIYCKQYEKKIIALGGLDFQLLGIGRSGHIGFNEPGSSVKCVTRLVHLDKITRTDAASDFMGLSKVPRSAITMGIATILSAKRIILLAWNENKSKVVTKAIEGPITENVPASYLQLTQAAECVIDKPAAVYLTRNQCPWTIKGIDTDPFVEYNDFWMIKAIIWLCKKTGKPILRLTEKDYEDNGLIDLVYQRGNGQSGVVNMLAYEMMKSKISGWPAGGRPNISSTDYFTQAQSTKKERILIFSPHPDDDVICMGGTMEKLIRQGHDVHVSYQTSGNLAVFDHDAERFNDFVLEYANIMGLSEATRKEIEARKTKIQRELDSKQDGQFDTEDMRKVKTIIRRTEAKMGAMECGVKKSQIYHLDLPFYESGSIKKKPLGEEDIQIVKNLIQKINPTMLFCAGDLTDPHGTHRVCLQAILKSLDQLQAEQNFLDTCQVLLYRGAWQEWDLEMVELAVPMSPEEVLIKRDAIYRHESQKDRAMFPGSDAREFWQRAEDRNRQTAELFKDMGLTQYQAIECFVSLQTLKTQNGI